MMAETKRLTGAEAWAELVRLEKTASPAPWVTVRETTSICRRSNA